METNTLDLDRLQTWIGRTVEQTDTILASWCNRLALALDREAALADGDVVMPLGHFITHPPLVATAELDADGHARRGDFLPPVALPRRMWAGSTFTFHDDLHIGDEVLRASTIDAIEMKEGRSGTLCFVTMKHELSVADQPRITELQDLVFREAPALDPAPVRSEPPKEGGRDEAAPKADFGRTIHPSEILLFRYSAVTFNSHRIHYDRDYATEVEGYEGLVVHGPLTATLLANLAVDELGGRLEFFSFRGRAPLVDTADFRIEGRMASEGRAVELWARCPSGTVAMTATARLAR